MPPFAPGCTVSSKCAMQIRVRVVFAAAAPQHPHEVPTTPPRLVGAYFGEALVTLKLNFDTKVAPRLRYACDAQVQT